MKLIGMTICAAAVAFASLGAAAAQTETKSKITVKDGKEVDVTGCVESSTSGSGDTFMLTHVADKKGAMHSYMLVSDEENFAKHVGHRVQISGKVADRGDGKVEVETKTKTKIHDGDDKETKSKSVMKGDMDGMAYLGVKSLKMVAAVCP